MPQAAAIPAKPSMRSGRSSGAAWSPTTHSMRSAPTSLNRKLRAPRSALTTSPLFVPAELRRPPRRAAGHSFPRRSEPRRHNRPHGRTPRPAAPPALWHRHPRDRLPGESPWRIFLPSTKFSRLWKLRAASVAATLSPDWAARNSVNRLPSNCCARCALPCPISPR